MAAGNYDITCEQGATLRRVFTWLDENDQPIDLTGCSARMQARPTHKSVTKWLDLTLGTGITINELEGEIVMLVSATATAALPVGRGVYDIEVVTSSGEVTRLVEGSFIITPEVTR